MNFSQKDPPRMINVLSSASEKGSLDDISDKLSQDDVHNKHPTANARPGYILGDVRSNLGQPSRLPKVDLAKFQALRSGHQAGTRPKAPKGNHAVRVTVESFLGKRQVPTGDKASSSTVAIKKGLDHTKTGATTIGSKLTTLSSSGRYSELSDEVETEMKPVVKIAQKSVPKVVSPSPAPLVAGGQLLIGHRKRKPALAGEANGAKAPAKTWLESYKSRTMETPPKSQQPGHSRRAETSEISVIETEPIEPGTHPSANLVPPAMAEPTAPVTQRPTADQTQQTTASATKGLQTALHFCFGTQRLDALSVASVAAAADRLGDDDTPVFGSYEVTAHLSGDAGDGDRPANSRDERRLDSSDNLPANPKNSLQKVDQSNQKCGMSGRRVSEYLRTIAEDVHMQQQLHSFCRIPAEASLEELFGPQTELLMGVLREGPGQLVAEHTNSRGRSLEVVYGPTVEEFFSNLCLPKPRDLLEILSSNSQEIPLLALHCTSIEEFLKYQSKIAEYYGVNIKYMSTEELRLSVPCEAMSDANLLPGSMLLSKTSAHSSTDSIVKSTDYTPATRLGLTCIAEGTFNAEFFPEIEVCDGEVFKPESDPYPPTNSPAKTDPRAVCSKPIRCREMVTGVESYLFDILSNLVKEQVGRYLTQKDHFFSPACFGQQSPVHPTLRTAIVDMMVALSRAKQLKDATFFMMISIFDRYCWKSPWASLERNLTLSAWASYLIAAKVEEIYPMDFQELTAVWAPGLATLEKLVAAEEDIIKTLSFKLSVPNLYTYWTLVSRIGRLSQQGRFYGLYLAHIVSKHAEMNFYHPLLQSLAILYLVCRILRGRWWNTDLLKITNKTFFEVKCCAKSLLFFLHKDRADEEFDEISQKFDSPWYMHISRIDVSKLTLDVF